MNQNLTADIYSTAIPGYTEARDLAATLDQQARDVLTAHPGEAPGQNVSRLLTAAQEGRSVLDAAHEIIEQRRRQENTGEVHKLVFKAAQSAKQNVADLTTAHLLDVVAEIRHRVETVGEQLTDMPHPIPGTADAAIAADRVDDYKAAKDLVARWESLVTVYSAAVRSTLQPHEMRTLAAAAFTPDPLEQHPVFLDRRAHIADAAAFAVRTPAPLAPLIDWARARTSAGNFAPRISGGDAQPEGANPRAWVLHLVQDGPLTVHDPDTALRLWTLAEVITAPLDPQRPTETIARHTALAEYHDLLGEAEKAEHHANEAQALDRSRRRGALFG
ncbi:hypothetical protein [Kocuria sp. U4B]